MPDVHQPQHCECRMVVHPIHGGSGSLEEGTNRLDLVPVQGMQGLRSCDSDDAQNSDVVGSREQLLEIMEYDIQRF